MIKAELIFMKLFIPVILLCLLFLTSCSDKPAVSDLTSHGNETSNIATEKELSTVEEKTTIADNDYAAIAKELTFILLDDDNSTETKKLCDSYFEEYLKAQDAECEYINIGRCDSMNVNDDAPQIKRHLTGGYVYCVDRSWEQHYCYYVNPDKKAVYSCAVDSDMALCWKDGLAADEITAAEFAKKILGESTYKSANDFYADLDGYYSLYYIPANSYIHISWDLKQIFYEKIDPDISYEDYQRELHLIYPEDTIGYFS